MAPTGQSSKAHVGLAREAQARRSPRRQRPTAARARTGAGRPGCATAGPSVTPDYGERSPGHGHKSVLEHENPRAPALGDTLGLFEGPVVTEGEAAVAVLPLALGQGR